MPSFSIVFFSSRICLVLFLVICLSKLVLFMFTLNRFFLCFLVVCWASHKTNILNSLSGKLQIFISFESVTGKLWCCLVVSCFLDFFFFFFVLFEILHCYFHIWGSSHLLQSLLSDFGREIASVIPAKYSNSWTFSVDMPAPYFLFLFGDGGSRGTVISK